MQKAIFIRLNIINKTFLFVLFGLSLVGSVSAAPADFDAMFGAGGKVTTAVGGGNSFILDTTLQPDGKIVAVGAVALNGSDFAVLRYNPSGALDTTFDGDGMAFTDLGSANDAAKAVAIQPEGRIFLAGVTKTGFENYDLALMRLNAGGGADQTFGTNGKAILPLSNKDDSVNDVIVQPNGHLLLAGASLDSNQRFSFTISRLLGRHTIGDYDSDGRADIGVYRPSSGTWYVQRSLAGTSIFQFGLSGDKTFLSVSLVSPPREFRVRWRKTTVNRQLATDCLTEIASNRFLPLN